MCTFTQALDFLCVCREHDYEPRFLVYSTPISSMKLWSYLNVLIVLGEGGLTLMFSLN